MAQMSGTVAAFIKPFYFCLSIPRLGLFLIVDIVLMFHAGKQQLVRIT